MTTPLKIVSNQQTTSMWSDPLLGVGALRTPLHKYIFQDKTAIILLRCLCSKDEDSCLLEFLHCKTRLTNTNY